MKTVFTFYSQLNEDLQISIFLHENRPSLPYEKRMGGQSSKRNVDLAILKKNWNLLKCSLKSFELLTVKTPQNHVLYGFAEHCQATLIEISAFKTDPYIDALGFHTHRKPKPLPHDVENFTNSSRQRDVVIYFSKGSNIKSECFPLDIRNAFLKTLVSLIYQVLWKFENRDLISEPKNAIYPNKLPFCVFRCYDQFLNCKREQRDSHEFGLQMIYHNLSKIIVDTTIQELLAHKQNKLKAEKFSQRYRNQSLNPLEKAFYWNEFVLCHHETTHLRSEYLGFWQQNIFNCLGIIKTLSSVQLFLRLTFKLFRNVVNSKHKRYKREQEVCNSATSLRLYVHERKILSLLRPIFEHEWATDITLRSSTSCD
uniref:Uncharacterized protein n=1 Tax=Glossina palpalis gambiensis TaxID=67801 RepID=A0A1B0ARZ5_9MUSC